MFQLVQYHIAQSSLLFYRNHNHNKIHNLFQHHNLHHNLHNHIDHNYLQIKGVKYHLFMNAYFQKSLTDVILME